MVNDDRSVLPFALDGSQMSMFEDEGIVVTSKNSTDSVKFDLETQYSSAEYQADVYAGNRIAYYKLEKELGSGKFSRVKIGEHTITKDKVAVKIVEKARIESKRHHILKREIRMLDSVHHPNVIRLFEVSFLKYSFYAFLKILKYLC